MTANQAMSGANERAVGGCRRIILYLFAYLLLPLYWLLCMAVKRNQGITGALEVLPVRPTLDNFAVVGGHPLALGAP